jgi:hypothetical protein
MEGVMNVVSVFSHTHNAPRVAKQEYDHAKAHYREVCDNFNVLSPDHQRRFRDATERMEAAREVYLRSLGT